MYMLSLSGLLIMNCFLKLYTFEVHKNILTVNIAFSSNTLSIICIFSKPVVPWETLLAIRVRMTLDGNFSDGILSPWVTYRWRITLARNASISQGTEIHSSMSFRTLEINNNGGDICAFQFNLIDLFFWPINWDVIYSERGWMNRRRAKCPEFAYMVWAGEF